MASLAPVNPVRMRQRSLLIALLLLHGAFDSSHLSAAESAVYDGFRRTRLLGLPSRYAFVPQRAQPPPPHRRNAPSARLEPYGPPRQPPFPSRPSLLVLRESDQRSNHEVKQHLSQVLILMMSVMFMFDLIPMQADKTYADYFPSTLALPSRLVAHAATVRTAEAAATTTTATSTSTPAKTGMSCVASYCASELKDCLQNPTCAKGLGCFVSCAAPTEKPSSLSSVTTSTTSNENNKLEGACQVRCTDLYESPELNAFTKCTLTEHGCYPALPEDERYPRLPRDLSAIASSPSSSEQQLQYLSQRLRGRWYVSAGLNKVFDVFDCQCHDFEDPSSKGGRMDEESEQQTISTADHTSKKTLVVADATFSYRVPIAPGSKNKFLTKVGRKRLYLKDGTTNVNDDVTSTTRATLQFETGKKWGLVSFPRTSATSTTTTASFSLSSSKRLPQQQLALTTVPDYMNYEDEWTILASSSSPSSSQGNNDQSTDFMVVAYRGENAAWEGYGGLNVYTRVPIANWKQLVSSSNDKDQRAMLQGIQQGLEKVGLTIEDLVPVDNSCAIVSPST